VIGRLKKYLEENGVPYEVLRAPEETFTAQETAAAMHVSGKEMIKPVLVKVDGRMSMAVLPAWRLLDFRKMALLVGAEEIRLAKESEFRELFPDCDLGAEPPFGNLYGLEVLLDDHLLSQQNVTFLAGSYKEALQISRSDYERLARPKTGDFCQEART
jgi:Ala-tRNA(Pro) deacylase